MLNRLLSHDLPRSRWLGLALLAILVALAVAPFVFPGSKALGVASKVLIFIVIIIGGLGSTLGCFVGALLVGLLINYTGFVAPVFTAFASIALMVAVLLWRPQGLYPVANR